MSKEKPRSARFEVEWITIKYRTLQRWVLAFVLVIGGVVGTLLWQRHQVTGVRDDAVQALALAERDLKEVKAVSPEGSVAEPESAVGLAVSALANHAYDESLRASLRARKLLSEIAKPVVDSAQILSVEGEVTLRRVGTLDWVVAAAGMTMAPGDLLKTHGGAAAQISNVDGSTATLRPDTLLKIARSAKDKVSGTTDVAVEVTSGRLMLSTGETQAPGSTAEVKTANVSASLERNTLVGVGFEQAAGRTELGVFEGVARFRSGTTELSLGASDRVEVTAQGITRLRLPGVPRLLSPPPHKLLLVKDLAGQPIELEWESSRDARAYNVELSQTPLFTKVLRSWENHAATFVSVDGLAPGRLYWRVTSVSREGIESGPSAASLFRISDAIPEGPKPGLLITDVQALGEGVFVFEGKSQPGVFLQIDDGNQVTYVQPQRTGEFRQVIQIPIDGVHTVTITARNSQGLESRDHRQVTVRLP